MAWVAAKLMAATEHYLQTKRGFTDSDLHAGQKRPKLIFRWKWWLHFLQAKRYGAPRTKATIISPPFAEISLPPWN